MTTEYAPLDPDSYKHAAVLHKALHAAHPVLWDGKVGYIQVIISRLAGGRVETEAYLTGNPQCIDIKDIALYENA
jgi:hypothetical protein